MLFSFSFPQKFNWQGATVLALTFSFSTISFGECIPLLSQASTPLKGYALSEKWASDLFEKSKSPMIEKDISVLKLDGPTVIKVEGVPSSVKLVKLPRAQIFRHYTDEALKIIVENKELKAGPVPYVIARGGTRKIFEDLTGIFLTTPQTRPEKIGLSQTKAPNWIDMELSAGTYVLEIEPEIYLLPGPKGTASWLKASYEKYKKTGILPALTGERDIILEFERNGGVPDALSVPVKITLHHPAL